MLCKLFENGRSKCDDYYNKNLKSNNFKIENLTEKEYQYLTHRTITLSKKGEKRLINQLHFLNWPDHGVPDINTVYDTFEMMIKKIEQHNETPIVVHCSAGVGRTGTFLSIYNLYYELEKQKTEKIKVFNIWNTVRKLKEMRLFLVENKNQYYFVHNFISQYLKKIFKK